MRKWEDMGELANVAQVTGLDAVRLIALIAKSASSAKMHKKNCRQFSQHLKLIGNLLEHVSELKSFPVTREPLEQLEDALKRALLLVESCRDRSYLYLLAMGWSIVYQFRQAQMEIDRYLKIIPLITLVDNRRIKERLQVIEKDHREYTLDEEEVEVHNAILKPERTREDAQVLEKSLSRRYPHLAFEEALREENEKLHIELQRSQVNNDTDQCDVIQHLIEVTETVVNTLPEKNQTRHPDFCSHGDPCVDHSCRHHQDGVYSGSRYESTNSSNRDLISRSPTEYDEWQTDLFGCCMEPCLCMETCFYPCGTFGSIATVASKGNITREHACSDLMAYSLVLGCCCYTCCVRRKLRKLFSIRGGSCDDFLTHLMCCCCALVQEWREIEKRGYGGWYLKLHPFFSFNVPNLHLSGLCLCKLADTFFT